MVFIALIVAKTITFVSILRILVEASARDEETSDAMVENMAT